MMQIYVFVLNIIYVDDMVFAGRVTVLCVGI